jgi:hypothetical protein
MQNGDAIFLVVLAAIGLRGVLTRAKPSVETTQRVLTIGGVMAKSASALFPVLFAFREPLRTPMGVGSLQAMMFLCSITTAAFWLIVPHRVL